MKIAELKKQPLYATDPKYKELVDALITHNELGRILPPEKFMSANPSAELARQVYDVVPDAFVREDWEVWHDEFDELLAEVRLHYFRATTPRADRFVESAGWAAIKTGSDIGEAIANPTKVVKGVWKLTTDPTVRQELLDKIKTKLSEAESAEDFGELSVEVTVGVTAAGTAVKLTSKLAVATTKIAIKVGPKAAVGLKDILLRTGKLSAADQQVAELLKVRGVWRETPADRFAKATELPDEVVALWAMGKKKPAASKFLTPEQFEAAITKNFGGKSSGEVQTAIGGTEIDSVTAEFATQGKRITSPTGAAKFSGSTAEQFERTVAYAKANNLKIRYVITEQVTDNWVEGLLIKGKEIKAAADPNPIREIHFAVIDSRTGNLLRQFIKPIPE